MFKLFAIVVSGLFYLNAKAQAVKPFAKPKALVELFTSQGCSSCPGAHSIVENIYSDPLFGQDSVLTLSFHVDYWDDLGWKDTFSKKQFTTRQKNYQDLFNAEGVYTPQFVINGRSGFSGNNEPRLRRELKALYAASKLMNTGLKLKELIREDQKLIFTYLVDGNSENKMLHAAIISCNDTTLASAGENAGLALSSRNTILNLVQLPLKSPGSRAFVYLPKEKEKKNLKFVLWVQDANNAQVLDILLFNLPE